jgi:tetratricopeptide (TPR) repeat protein
MEYRLAWAKTALKIHDLRSAADALSNVNDSTKSTATYHKLGGALAWDLHNAAEAEKQYTEALRLEPTNAAITLNLATIRLASTNAEIANAARLSMEQMATAKEAEIRNTALHYLAADANSHGLYGKAISYSKQLLQDPSASFSDRIVHLEFLREAKSEESAAWQASLEKEAASTPGSAFLFGKWMASADNPGVALAWLRRLPQAIQTNQPVPLIITDCQIALKDWSGLLALVTREDWGELGYYRLALEALAQRSLGKDTSATAAWQKAVRQSAHRLDNLSRLAQVTAAWRWMPEHSEVLEKITTAFPKETWATDQLVAQLYAQGDTRGIQTLLTRVQASDPTDARLKNNLADVFLLRNSEVQKANRLAKEAYDAAPDDPFFASTYAYSLLLQNRRDDAVGVFAHVKKEYLQIPTVAAYYGVIQAQCGHNDIAKGSLARADAGKLLPEEKELVRLAKARL